MGGQECPNFPIWFAMVRGRSPGLEMANIWRIQSIQIQTNFSLNQTNLVIQTNSLKLQNGMRTNF